MPAGHEGGTPSSHWPPALTVVCIVAFVGGWAAWAVFAATGDKQECDRAWRAVLVNFLYFFPLSIAMVVWPAIARLARGRWAVGPLERTAWSGIAFAPVAVAMFALLFLGREHWAWPWMYHWHPPQQAWLNVPFLFTRDAAAILLLLSMGAIYVRRMRKASSMGVPPVPEIPQSQTQDEDHGQDGRGTHGQDAHATGHLGSWLVLTFCLVLTLIGFDMVMALQPVWFSTLFGGYFFITSAYMGLAAWTLASLVRLPGLESDRRHDLGKLIVAFGLLSTYMMYSQLIVIWYENLPHEVPFVIPRLNFAPWKFVSAALLGTIYLGPLVSLLFRRAKKSVPYLAVSAGAILAAMWVERWWLVTPTLGGEFTYGWTEIAPTVGCLAAMLLGMRWFLRRPAIQEVPHS